MSYLKGGHVEMSNEMLMQIKCIKAVQTSRVRILTCCLYKGSNV